MHSGEYDQALVQAQLGLALSREIGHGWGIGHSFWVLGFVALAEEAYAVAEQFLQESVATFRELGQLDELGSVLGLLGMTSRGLGRLSQARQPICEALRIADEIQGFTSSMSAMRAGVLLLAHWGDLEREVELYALVSRYSVVRNSRLSEGTAGKHATALAASLLPEVVAEAQEGGRARDLEATVAELLAELKC